MFLILILAVYFATALNYSTAQIACNCYMLGTRENSEGQSICNKTTGICSCLKNIDGMNCDICKVGYFDIQSGTGCKLCKCDVVGSLSKHCNIITGECDCKPGFTGTKCDQCQYTYYRILKSCKACGCNPSLSTHLECDIKGKCECNQYAIGDKCERCVTNYYTNHGAGCSKCNDCYDIVELTINNLKNKLKHIRELSNFQQKLNDLKSEINSLLDILFANNISFKELDEIVDQLNNLIARCKELSNESKINSEFINSIELELKLIQTNLEMELNKWFEKYAINIKQNMDACLKDIKNTTAALNSYVNTNAKELNNTKKMKDSINTNLKSKAIKTLNTSYSLNKKAGEIFRLVSHLKPIEPTTNYTDFANISIDVEKYKFEPINIFDNDGKYDQILKINEFINVWKQIIQIDTTFNITSLTDLLTDLTQLKLDIDILTKNIIKLQTKILNVQDFIIKILNIAVIEDIIKMNELVTDLEIGILDQEDILNSINNTIKEYQNNLKELHELEEDINKKIEKMKEIIIILNFLLDINDQYDDILHEIKLAQDYLDYYNSLLKQKTLLEVEVKNIEEIVNALPSDTYCITTGLAN